MPTNFSRSPITITEIVQPTCANVYGVAPCTATDVDQCRNTRATCKDILNYNQSASISIKFGKPGVVMPPGEYIIPALMSTNTAPSVINPSGASRNRGALGERAVCKSQILDFKHSDFLVDPYRTSRAYDPGERSTFWPKWLARNPYHEGYIYRVYDGYEGQTLAEMSKREYLIDRIDGPTNGTVSITAKDPLKMVDNLKALAPLASTGKLVASIADSGAVTTFDVYDSLSGDYPAPGTVRIGDELFTYTGSSWLAGTTTLTGVTRSTDGSQPDGHDADDTVQWCLRITNTPAWQVARDLLQDYANVPPTFIPYTAWNTECLQFIPGYTVTTLISEPTGVNTLLSELSQQCLFYIWWDERDAEIKLRTIRTVPAADKTVTDNNNIIADSVKITRKPEARISQVWVRYLPRDLSKKIDDTGNYRTRRVRIDANAELEYGSKRVLEINSRWLESDAQAIATGARILASSRDTPQHIKLRLDAKDRDLWTADIVDVQTRDGVDTNGVSRPFRYQVMSAEEVMPGETVEYDLIRFIFSGRPAFWMRADAPVYSAASDADKTIGAFWADESGLMSDGTSGYTWQ